MEMTDQEYVLQMAGIARRAVGNAPEGIEHVARLEKIAARLDDARVVLMQQPMDGGVEADTQGRAEPGSAPPNGNSDVPSDRGSSAPPVLQLAEGFGDPETLFNSRDWMRKAIEARGAKVTGGGVGMGQSDLDFTLEGCKFNISLRPIVPERASNVACHYGSHDWTPIHGGGQRCVKCKTVTDDAPVVQHPDLAALLREAVAVIGYLPRTAAGCDYQAALKVRIHAVLDALPVHAPKIQEQGVECFGVIRPPIGVVDNGGRVAMLREVVSEVQQQEGT